MKTSAYRKYLKLSLKKLAPLDDFIEINSILTPVRVNTLEYEGSCAANASASQSWCGLAGVRSRI
jgi:hypothetical protein